MPKYDTNTTDERVLLDTLEEFYNEMVSGRMLYAYRYHALRRLLEKEGYDVYGSS